ncbi:hypothetical protein F4809DRAFT_605222 [Biscogniauxia mediterranea]|nr:hypothetical protein F4809DRAFT_605222 [Biscogniauxia mediterranea]
MLSILNWVPRIIFFLFFLLLPSPRPIVVEYTDKVANTWAVFDFRTAAHVRDKRDRLSLRIRRLYSRFLKDDLGADVRAHAH